MQFIPAVYEHAAAVIGKRPWDVSRDGELLYRAHEAAWDIYRHSPVVVGIDIYCLEPEAYGAAVGEPVGNGIPAIAKPAVSSLDELEQINLFNPSRDGRIPMVLDVGERLKKEIGGGDVDVRIPVSGPFSIAGNLIGFDVLVIGSITEPERARRALEHFVDGQIGFVEEIHKRGLGISLFESGASPPMLSPEIFREVALPPLKRLVVEAGRITGCGVGLIMGGDTVSILEDILSAGANFIICPAETDRAKFMEKLRERTDIAVRVNMTPSVVASGTWDEIKADVDTLLEIIGERQNTSIGTGPLPYETKPENVLRIQNLLQVKIHDILANRGFCM